MNFEEEGTDSILIALSHHQRREALNILREANRPLALADLALELTHQLEDTSCETETQRQAERLQIELYHCHIPKLESAGLVEFDTDQNVVLLTEAAGDTDILDLEFELTATGQ